MDPVAFALLAGLALVFVFVALSTRSVPTAITAGVLLILLGAIVGIDGIQNVSGETHTNTLVNVTQTAFDVNGTVTGSEDVAAVNSTAIAYTYATEKDTVTDAWAIMLMLLGVYFLFEGVGTALKGPSRRTPRLEGF